MQIGIKKKSVFLSLAFVLLYSLLLLNGFALAGESTGGGAEGAYTVQFFDWDNSVLYTEQVNAGETVALPDIETAEREYHVFSHWFDVSADRSIPYDFERPVNAPVSLKAFYSLKPDLDVSERLVLIYKDCPPIVTDGESVTVVGELVGFDGCNVFLQWQYLDENNKWVNIEGANSLTFQFPATRETINREYRLGVTVLN